MEKKVSQLKGHTIVCGFGRMGEIICKKLLEEGVTFVVVEKKDVDIRDFQKLGYNFILGDAANDEILQKAGIENAKVLISVIDNDSDGLYIALSGRSFNPDLQIIIRANEPSAQKRMMKAGADKVVLPFVMSGLKVADSVINPAVEDFLNIRGFAGSNNESELIHLADLFIPKESPLVSKSIKEVGPDLDKMLIVGIRKLDHKFVFHPGGSYTFEEGDCLIIMGDQESYNKTRNMFNLKTSYLSQNS